MVRNHHFTAKLFHRNLPGLLIKNKTLRSKGKRKALGPTAPCPPAPPRIKPAHGQAGSRRGKRPQERLSPPANAKPHSPPATRAALRHRPQPPKRRRPASPPPPSLLRQDKAGASPTAPASQAKALLRGRNRPAGPVSRQQTRGERLKPPPALSNRPFNGYNRPFNGYNRAASHPLPGPAAPLPPRRARGQGSAPPLSAAPGHAGGCSSPAPLPRTAAARRPKGTMGVVVLHVALPRPLRHRRDACWEL